MRMIKRGVAQLMIGMCILCAGYEAYAEENTMNLAAEATTLNGLEFNRHGMATRDNYNFTLKTTEHATVIFSARCFPKGQCLEVYDVAVPATVMEELATMACANGKPTGGPAQQTPKPIPDYPTWNYSLQWADGSTTGPGAAWRAMVEYLHALAVKCAEERP